MKVLVTDLDAEFGDVTTEDEAVSLLLD